MRTLAPALAVTLALVVLDIAIGGTTALVPLLVVGPLVAAATAGAHGTTAIGILSVLGAVVLGLVAEEVSTANHLVAITTVAVGAGLAAAVAGSRERHRHAREDAERALARADLLARASALFEGGADPMDHLEAVAALPVPLLADLGVVDLTTPDGRIVLGGVAARDHRVAQALRASRRRHPVPPGGDHPVAVVIRTGEPLLEHVTGDGQLERWATDDDHLELMRRAGYASLVVVPLSARGRTIGTLALVRLTGGRRYEPDDLEVAAAVARRAGLAIDHARLGRELGAISSDLQAVIGALSDAITVQGADGRLLYANEEAARISGLDSVEAMLARHPRDIMAAWQVLDEDGEPLGYDDMPGPRALAGEPTPQRVVQVVDPTTGRRLWRRNKAMAVPGPDGRPRLAVNVIEDITEQRRRELAQTFLAEASKLLTASLDPQRTLHEVARAAVPDLADWCAVDLPDERGVLRRVATADRSPERTRDATLVIRERSGDAGVPVGPPQVLRTGVSELYPEITDELLRAAAADPGQLEALRAVGARSVLVVPMTGAGGRPIGTITMGTIESQRRLTTDDLLLAEELGRRAGIAVEHARIHRELAGIATTLQAALLPPSLPDVPGVELAARFRAAAGGETVGGDFYDVFEVPGTPPAWMVVMGDVTGKGPGAAAITALARYTIRTAAFYERAPSRILGRLNHALVHDDDRRRLCTALCARIEPHPGRGVTMTLSCAGHPLPLRSRPDGTVDELGEPGTLLGAFPDGRWSDVTLRLAPGDDVLLYTDGVTDIRGPDERFGGRRLREVVARTAGRPAAEVASALVEALVGFQDQEAQRDDIALLVLRARK
ncbi:MAG: SpoIIE family protein phosphatase [Solirubrobacteraceae bacterium]|nr:SpoIIE family protein phosphatase [Solirubrobacteraceae bacterium]